MTIVALDLETTGLDPSNDLILEVGVVILDSNLHELDRKSWVISGRAGKVREILSANDYVRDMHSRSGLLLDVLGGAGVREKVARQQIRDYLADWQETNASLDPLPLTLLGFSVGSFDLDFLRHQWPEIASLFAHSVIDASTARKLLHMAGLHSLLPGGPTAHRALADCSAAIATVIAARKVLINWAADSHPEPTE